MSIISLSTYTDMSGAATPSSGIIMGLDTLDGKFKQKDSYGVVTEIGAVENYLGGPLGNFIPNLISGGSLNIDSSNQDTYCAGFYHVTGAVIITIDGSVRNGFSLNVIQEDANSCTFNASGGLTLRNRQSHTNSAGRWALCSLLVSGTNLILTGDTA